MRASTSPYKSTSPYDFSRTATSPPASWAHHRCTPEGAAKSFPQTTTCAEKPLKYYNSKHGTEYKLVKPINSGVVLYDKVWLHAKFTTSESSREDHCNSSPKLFFAELMFIGLENSIELYSVTACCPLDGKRMELPKPPKDSSKPEGNESPRVLDVFYTNQGTKLFVKDGVLVEEKIESSSPKSHGPVDYDSDIPECFRGQVFTYYRDPPEPPAPKEDAEKQRTLQTIELAIPALEYYNRKQRTNYKLVDPLCSNGVLLDGIWYHCNFTASEASQDGCADSAPKLFFAELKIARVTKDAAVYSVTTCCRLANGKSTTRCDMCDEDELLHPTNGRFLQGTCDREHSLRPRRNH